MELHHICDLTCVRPSLSKSQERLVRKKLIRYIVKGLLKYIVKKLLRYFVKTHLSMGKQ